MKLYRAMRNNMERNIDNKSGMELFKGDVVELDNYDLKSMPKFISDSETSLD